jgi:hypothetical protein
VERELGIEFLLSYCLQRRWAPHNLVQVMNVFIVLFNDSYATHFCGAFESQDAANQFVELQDREEVDGEYYVINEVPVRKTMLIR